MDQDANSQPVIPVDQVQGTEKKKSGLMKKIGIVIVLIVGAVIALGAVLFFATKGASDTAANIVENLQAGECKLIYDTQTSVGFRDGTSSEEWNEGCPRVSTVLTGEPEKSGVNVSAQSGEASRSEVGFVIDGTDGETYDVTLSMIKEDDEWKLFSLESISQSAPALPQ